MQPHLSSLPLSVCVCVFHAISLCWSCCPVIHWISLFCFQQQKKGIKCPRRHEMKKLSRVKPPTYNGPPYCDSCDGQNLHRRDHFFNCKKCKYDLWVLFFFFLFSILVNLKICCYQNFTSVVCCLVCVYFCGDRCIACSHRRRNSVSSALQLGLRICVEQQVLYRKKLHLCKISCFWTVFFFVSLFTRLSLSLCVCVRMLCCVGIPFKKKKWWFFFVCVCVRNIY